MTKNEYRLYSRNLLKNLSSREREKWNTQLIKTLVSSKVINRGSALYLYFPLISEPDISPFALKALAEERTIGVPVIKGREMSFRSIQDWNGDNWELNPFGIPEPVTGEKMLPENTAGLKPIILIPGLLFDLKGNRLGRGGGYYDRWLAQNGKYCLKIGIAFPFQVMDDIPAETHDMPVDYVCNTEAMILIKR